MLREIQLAAATPDVVAAELGLRQLLGMSELAHSMISVDTGPAHAAAALGLPLVVMFGAESQREWLPRSPSGSTVLGIGGPPFGGLIRFPWQRCSAPGARSCRQFTTGRPSFPLQSE